MIYKYIFYKIYQWISQWIDTFGPQCTTTLILSLLPVSILYSILHFTGLFARPLEAVSLENESGFGKHIQEIFN